MIAGRYSLAREIGRGGMGSVWLGRDEVLGRLVALKRVGIVPGADHADFARAEREAQLSARLHHPNVVAVFDFVADDETDDHWLVMEYVDGTTITDLVRQRGRLSPDEATPILRQVAEGLAAAHAEGIVHRDVKPSNILVDESGTVKLTDFGIARTAADPSLTQTGLVIGSPTYLAPEVASGGRGDERVDVWSFGATAYYLLAGRPPYDVGDNVLSTLYRIVNDDPPVLPDADWLAPMLAGTMAKDPDSRWTMAQVHEFLGHPHLVSPLVPAEVPSYVDPEPTLTTMLPPARWWSPFRIVLLAVASLVVVLGVVLYAALADHGSGGGPAAPAAAASTPKAGASAKPTAAGMESFIRSYVSTVSDDPDRAWTMLTPKFQRASGGLAHYRDFWSAATNGRVLDITADPEHLSVSYHVHFDDFDNGPGPTVLSLVFRQGHYLIDAEHTRGFVPAD